MENVINIDEIVNIKKEKKFTTKILSQMSGVPKGTLDKIFSGQTKDPKIQTLISICSVLDCELYEILNCTKKGISKQDAIFLNKYHNLDSYGKMAIDTLIDVENKRIQNDKTLVYPKLRRINHYVIGASAGTGMLLTSGDYDVFHTENCPQNADYTVSVSGNSMEPLFYDGDILFVEKTQNVNIGEIGIFVLNNESYVKRLGKNSLISENPAYLPIMFSQGDEINVCGKVLGKGTLTDEKVIIFND